MRATLLYLFFLSCGFAEETSVPESADIILLDVNKRPFAEENHVPKPEDDDIFAKVEDLQRELNAERAKNRDLNQTISDILEEMEGMKNHIIRNEEKIIDNQSSYFLLSRDVDDLQEDVEENSALITDVFEDVVSLTSSDQQHTLQIESLNSSYQKQAIEIESLSSQIDSLGARGHWCGYQYSWDTAYSIINYDKLTLSDSNMNITGTPLDTKTGILKQSQVFFIWILIFVTFQGSSLCQCLETGNSASTWILRWTAGRRTLHGSWSMVTKCGRQSTRPPAAVARCAPPVAEW